MSFIGGASNVATGLGRKLMQTFGNEGDSAVPSQENAGFSRVLSSDYTDPGPDTNESGYYISPSDQTPDVP
ncbi:hypothetical protein RHMOL_Rhmol08G0078800 [Rhododendron molle]|uniref:Uncharacterized protein n=1 Tax=Rhododendron molle TaxID=49168 RepID=A0ACC0ML88_RHOML|nr:hypothetical protein RHMOL_Rhmol08G0078800 [Rhododendron molle]